MTRVRLVAWRVQPIVMADDGDQLVPIPVQPADIPASQWQDFKDGGDELAIDQIREQFLKASDG